MPIAKYFCDYCDKQFQDTPAARRRHLQGVAHQRNKKSWFDSFQEPGHQQAGSAGQKVCLQYMRTGFCHFGARCRFQHISVQDQSTSQCATKGNHDAVKALLPAAVFNLPPSLRPSFDTGYWQLPQVDWG